MTDTKNTVSDELLVIEPGYTTSFDTAINCLRDEAKACDRTNRVGRMSMLNAIANELVALQSLRASIPGGVRVKGLEWVKHPTAEIWRSDTILGGYKAIAMRKTGWMFDGLDGEEKSVEGLTSIEAAKAAAQADYERRILSALDLSPAEGRTDRDHLGRLVREAWVRWAETQPSPKASWLVPYDDLSEPDKEADRQIGEAIFLYAAPSNPVISDDLAKRVFDAAWACPHTIEHGSVILRVDHSKPGNALRQLRDRITAALSVKPQSGSDKP